MVRGEIPKLTKKVFQTHFGGRKVSMTNLDCRKMYFRRGKGTTAVLKHIFSFGFPGQKAVLHVTYVEDGGAVQMVKASAFRDMFAEEPMIPVAEPRREKTADKFRRNGWFGERAS